MGECTLFPEEWIIGLDYYKGKEFMSRVVVVQYPIHYCKANPNTRVYLGIIDGEPDYVGIAYDVERRQSQHGDRFDYLREITTEPLTRRQARAIEQAMIKNHPEYSNKINSISTKRDWYNDAVTWGKAWLREHGLLE